MKKKIIVITMSNESGIYYKNLLFDFFGNLIEVETLSFEHGVFSYLDNADLYFIGATASDSSDFFEYVLSLVPDREKIVVSRLTFKKAVIDKLRKYPKGTKALLVNLSYNMAIETVADLHRNDITNIDFFPIGPDSEDYPDIDLAITPAESRYVPKTVKKVIDIGYRVFSVSVVVEIALKLGFQWFLKSDKYKNYINELSEDNYSIHALADETVNIENRLEILIESMDIGIIGIDADRRIFICNKSAKNMLSITKDNIIGEFLWEVNKQFHGIERWENDVDQKASKLIYINKMAISVTKAPIIWKKNFNGYFILLQKFTEEEKRQQNLRMQFYERGYRSKYTFDDIKGNCRQIVKAKAIAQKMAVTDASILLTGESGTGKELFAHSIHHASQRSSMPFVAINCAALPETLLESELFGYGEGAFTGAKKGGKMGLFEYAHKGTLFLDEIEGMSKNLQIKLLRVLQEKEIMRIGENRIIPIDVRIIAATNENIYEMVKCGKFRKDLYYRINTLPVVIPPLRERGDDIFLLAENICSQIGAEYVLSPDTKEVFRKYYWDGNVRELKNILEYLKFLDKKEILPSDLPDVMFSNSIKNENTKPCNRTDFEKIMDIYTEKAIKIMDFIRQNPGRNGRRSIYGCFKKEGISISESEIRNILSLLFEGGYINISQGRGGNCLTKMGQDILQM
ncbi:MAG: sigma 54-interacting transcriptional regulator [Clostridia bacterium]|jgi:transcriptional regulator with PAS, ATPase and Fis domain|nr:sigma 54-interacting transcriptional regulator [Clostridia bacterium]MCI2014824.1 sigma 54-interacting transcriptional regulator [Clostridia bacterium]